MIETKRPWFRLNLYISSFNQWKQSYAIYSNREIVLLSYQRFYNLHLLAGHFWGGKKTKKKGNMAVIFVLTWLKARKRVVKGYYERTRYQWYKSKGSLALKVFVRTELNAKLNSPLLLLAATKSAISSHKFMVLFPTAHCSV